MSRHTNDLGLRLPSKAYHIRQNPAIRNARVLMVFGRAHH